MAVLDQTITQRYALYNADCVEILRAMPDASVHLSTYSPPFATGNGGLYTYSSHERDLSNCDSYAQFFEHYEYVVRELYRVTMPGRISAVHCMDVPRGNSGNGGDTLTDFPGDIIRLHERCGFSMAARHFIWKEPLAVRNRTMQKNLAHRTCVEDSTLVGVASADQLLIMRRDGNNPVPVTHPSGLLHYAGEREVPSELRKFRGWRGNQIENRYSHWVWRQYASAFWDDINHGRVLPFRGARDSDDEKHVHPLQLDVIERCIVMRSNPGETVLTPFMGVGSEVYQAVAMGRQGVGVELKPSYYRQAVKNVAMAGYDDDTTQVALFDDADLDEEAEGDD
jgi:DNA modification methylase